MARSRKRIHHRILMVTTEAVPFAKSGGLADAVTALAQELDRAGHDVRLLMPRYYGIRRDQLFRFPSPLRVQIGEEHYESAVYEGRLPDSEVVVYFLDHEELFGRDGIYGVGGEAFDDNLHRFTVLSHAALTIGPRLGWEPEIIHSHDWPTALVPMLARRGQSSAHQPATVLTVHNLGYQGSYPVGMLPKTGLSWSELPESGLLHHDELNMLKAGILNADMVTTVSPTYAAEIQTPLHGFSLDQVLTSRSERLAGILNGVDYSLWNPERDHHLDVNYTAETVALKERSKSALQTELGLPVTNDVPLIGTVSRLVSQKGFAELLAPGYGALPTVLTEMPIQVVVLGTGEPEYEYQLRRLSDRFPNLTAIIGFDDGLAHRIEAGADFFLMPSRYEPCGLNQLYSLRYGTIPIVTRTGGLADTVRDVTPEGGTGIVLGHACPSEIINGIRRAVTMWKESPNQIAAVRRAGMKERYAWESAAGHYLEAYARAISYRASV
ncbi:MAG: glycogen synthase [Spirochaetales bacterium]|nr:glycogen synthase [Spirochaetales bacterium]